MQDGFKIGIGASAAALLAVAAHGPLGMGAAFVATLQLQADTAIAEAGILSDLRIAFPTAPLSRTAVLSGDAPEAERSLAIAAISVVRGVGAIRAQKAAAPAVLAATETATRPGANPSCRAAIDDAVAGRTLNFRSGSAYLSPQSNRIIHEVAAALKLCEGMTLEIGGHGNATGSDAINRAMSEERAKRVRDALVIQGARPDALRVRAYGASAPIDAAGAMDAANRRVVFSVIEGGA